MERDSKIRPDNYVRLVYHILIKLLFSSLLVKIWFSIVIIGAHVNYSIWERNGLDAMRLEEIHFELMKY